MSRHDADSAHPVLVAPGELLPGALVTLDDEELRHLRVRRAATGDPVRVHDASGAVGDGRLEERGRQWLVQIRDVARRDPPRKLTLCVGAGDKDRFAWIAEKAAELGVTDLVPLETERALSVATRLRSAHLDALRRRARQAVKQSGAAWAPLLREPAPLAAILTQAPEGEVRWLADAGGGSASAIDPAAPVAVVVGPEGGLTDAERELVIGAGYRPVRLAHDLLRFETAALAAAAVVAYQRSRSPA